VIIQRASSRTPVPWRNGKGVQYEIAADGLLPEGWTWRVSTADIDQDVPFSAYPGVHRDFCVAEGNGVVLTIDGVDHRCETHSVTDFRGDATVSAALVAGPVRALNLMRIDGSATDSWRVLRTGESGRVAHVAVGLSGGAHVRINGESIRLGTLDALLECDGAVVEVDSGILAVL
jgi:environmental stress-induced protein Ves